MRFLAKGSTEQARFRAMSAGGAARFVGERNTKGGRFCVRLTITKENLMLRTILVTTALVSIPAIALAQSNPAGGAAAGAATGAVGGAIVGGPVGAGVGAVGGAIVGAIAGSAQPQFQEYVVEQRHPVYRYDGSVAVGAILPDAGVEYYVVPDRFGPTEYRYTIVNDHTVLVDPRTRRIVQVID